MTDAERSATAPTAAVLNLDQQVMAYLTGRVSLNAVVELCVATLGPRPSLTVSLAHVDPGTRDRLRALDAALEEIRARAG